MKIKLLNDGGYPGLASVSFPIEVDGQPCSAGGYDVVSSDLLAFGADPECWDDRLLVYWRKSEVEVAK